MDEQFPFSFNPYCTKLDDQVLRWAWNEGLFEAPSELERCRTQQINSFCGFLYPDFDATKLELVMNFFLTLFLLDDLIDEDLGDEQLQFLEKLNSNEQVFYPGNNRLSRLGIQISGLFIQIGMEIISPPTRTDWQLAWQLYTSSILWEVGNKINGKIPDLSEYKTLRPFSSGVNLAILINRSDNFDESCRSVFLEGQIARYICLSNDLDSFEKEKEVQDFHNEVILLQLTTNKDVLPSIRRELRSLKQRILRMAEQLKRDSASCASWVDSLLQLVGGCSKWSRETFRYQGHLNGNSRLN